MSIEVEPIYVAVEAIRDICKPWIELHGGDEWGESMRDLHGAAKTCYGFSDEDCALFASKLIENLILTVEMTVADGEGPWGYGYDEESGRLALAETQDRAAEARDYWLKGGNVPSPREAETGKRIVDQLPRWLFEDSDIPA